MTLHHTAAALVALLVLTAAAPARADTAEVLANHIRPGYAALAGATEALASLDTCDPALLRPAFHDVYDAWMGVAHLHLGPVEDQGRALAIHFWPDPKGMGRKAQSALLAGDPAALTPDFMAEQSVAARGLPALERLLYPPEAMATDPCPLIQATADDFARMSSEILNEWNSFGADLETAGEPGNARFLTPAEARQALFTQLVTGLEFIADTRIGRPLGTFDRPRPDLAEARASARSQRNVLVSLGALRDLTLHLSPDAPLTLAALDRAMALAAALPDPAFADFGDTNGRFRGEVLQQAVRLARDTALAEVGPALGVTLGFNSQDGD